MRIKRSLSALIATILIAGAPLAASAQVSVGVGVAFGGPGWGVGIAAYSPPALPVYSMPPAPYPNWQWCPGYWGWGSYGYYWVPGYWTAPPAVGLYWTPGYWGYGYGGYAWYPGYWGPTVGFYGGVNYGYGYFGVGFVGGYWSGGVFNYNTAFVNVNRTVIRNTFVNRTVVNGTVVGRTTVTHSRVSFNGGRGGIRARATPAQLAARRHGIAQTAAQRANQRVAARDRGQLAAVNHGHPRVAAVQRPLSATHRPAGMHTITAADRRAAQRTMHHNISVAHHNAIASHGTVGATARHSAMTSHGSVGAPAHNSAMTRHGAVSAAPRHFTQAHSASTRGFTHAGYSGRSSGGYPHAMYGGRTGGGSHVGYGGRPPSGGFGRQPGGGRPAGGGGRRPPQRGA